MDSLTERMMQIPGVLAVLLPGNHIEDQDSYLVIVEIGTDFHAPVFPNKHDGKPVIYKELPRPIAEQRS